MTRPTTKRRAGFLVLLAAILAAPCRAGEDFSSWKPTSLGGSPFRETGAAKTDAAPRLESMKVDLGTTVVSTAAKFELGWPLIIAQRLPLERDVALVRFGHGAVLSAEQIDDSTCQVECACVWLTFHGDSVLVIKPKIEMEIGLLLLFKPEYQARRNGSVLTLDNDGGIGVSVLNDEAFQSEKRPVFWGDFGMSFFRDEAGRAKFERGGKAKAPDGKIAMGSQWQKDFGEILYRLKPGQELWLSVFPSQQPPDVKAFIDAVGKQVDPFEAKFPDAGKVSPEEYAAARAKRLQEFAQFDPYPGPEIRRFVNIPAFFHNAGLRKDIRNNIEITGGLYRTGGTVTVSQSNPRKAPLPVALKWDAPGWQITPAEASLKPEPGSSANATFTFGPSPAGPAPRLLATYELPGVDGKPVTVTHTYAMPLNETTDVPRIAALSGLDAVADALKDQEPRVIRSEGSGYVETRRAEPGASSEARPRTVPRDGDSSAELRLAVAGDSLAVYAKVSDPRCKPDVPEWKGTTFGIAGVDIYIGNPGSPRVRQFHFQAISPSGDKNLVFAENGTKCGDPTYPCRIVPLQPFGYEVHALIPLKDCLIEPDAKEFLVDAALLLKGQFRLLYTGDPVRCAYRNCRYFALALVPPPAKPSK